MAARKAAPCTHPAHLVQMVVWLGDHFVKNDGSHATRCIHWCAECGAISSTASDKGGKVLEGWRHPRRGGE